MASDAEVSWWSSFVDDAAVFPPGDAALSAAVPAYLARLAEPWADLVGPLVVPDRALPELPGLVDQADSALPISVVCSGGAGSLEPAARWAHQCDGLDLRSLELALRDLDDLPGSAQRVTRATDALAAVGLEVPVYVEVPPLAPSGRADRGWLGALDELAAMDLRLKFRTGGPEANLTPEPAALAAQIEAALDRELAFKCTAGLHHAVRRVDGGSGRAEHGFLNVLVATRASLEGDDVVAVLSQTDAAALCSLMDAQGHDALLRTRRWFTSFGCCGVEDPHDDLVALGLTA